jgi:hypothetical protein
LGSISSYNGIPLFSTEGQQWVQTRTGQQVAFNKLCAFGPPWHNQKNLGFNNPIQRNLQSLCSSELPDRKTVEEYLDLYNSTVFRRVFPVINTRLFTKTVNAVYDQSHADQYYPNASAKACIYAFMAFGSFLNIHKRGVPTIDSEDYALKAQYLIPQVLQEPVDLNGLQSAVMLVSICFCISFCH